LSYATAGGAKVNPYSVGAEGEKAAEDIVMTGVGNLVGTGEMRREGLSPFFQLKVHKVFAGWALIEVARGSCGHHANGGNGVSGGEGAAKLGTRTGSSMRKWEWLLFERKDATGGGNL